VAQANWGEAMYQLEPPRGNAPAIWATGRLRQLALPTMVTVFVLLAYLPFLDRPDPTSVSVSKSRVAELLLLAAAMAGGIALRGRRRRAAASSAAFLLITLVTSFSFWAMVTSFWGLLLLTGLIKAFELLATCFVAFQVAAAARASAPPMRSPISIVILLSVIVVLAVLIVSNLVLQGAPLPLSHVAAWPSNDGRPRLLLGANHPLTSALLLAFGVICCIDAEQMWTLKLPLLICLGWLLQLCDARGIGAGCIVGIVLSFSLKLPRSPYKLLLIAFVLSAMVLVAVTILLSGQVEDVVVGVAGNDVFSLNSRVGLWSYVLERVPDNPLMGVGYYSTRSYVLTAFPFAGHAHNSAIEVLFSTGLIGLSCFILFLVLWAYALVKTTDRLLIGVSPIALIEGSLDPILFTPGIGMFLFSLVLFNALFALKYRPSTIPSLLTGRVFAQTRRS
jgi:O-antigen ligase